MKTCKNNSCKYRAVIETDVDLFGGQVQKMDGQGQAEISMPEDNSSSLPGDLSPRQSKRWDRDAHINVVH